MNSAKNSYPRPFLKWAGGKSRLIEQYQDYFPKYYQTYYEVFLGGGAVFFYLQPENAVLTDSNADLINAYCCVRDKIDQLIFLLKEHQKQHSKEYYYYMRSYNGGDRVEQAARLIYLNKTCFNGLYRVNSQGQFNVPLGRYKNPGICQEEILRCASAKLFNTKILHADFTTSCNYVNSNEDFVYFDPPYYPISSTSYFTAYSSDRFGADQQIQLRDVFAKLANKGVKVMLSNSDCEFIRSLYTDFHIHSISATRAINSNPQKRGKISELLITSY